MARPSLTLLGMTVWAGAMALLGEGCLVTSDPSFDPSQTPPMFVGAGVSPTLRQPIVVQGTSDVARVILTGAIRSDDNGQNVILAAYVDYGFKREVNDPAPFLFPAGERTVPAGTLDTPRTFRMDVTATLSDRDDGCFSLTLFAMHAIDDDTGCPTPFDDSDQLVWLVRRCTNPEDCAIDVQTCQTPTIRGKAVVPAACPGDLANVGALQ